MAMQAALMMLEEIVKVLPPKPTTLKQTNVSPEWLQLKRTVDFKIAGLKHAPTLTGASSRTCPSTATIEDRELRHSNVEQELLVYFEVCGRG